MQVMSGTRVGVGSPAGYPTLKTLVVTPALQHAGVEVFGQGSKKESLILQVVVRAVGATLKTTFCCKFSPLLASCKVSQVWGQTDLSVCYMLCMEVRLCVQHKGSSIRVYAQCHD